MTFICAVVWHMIAVTSRNEGIMATDQGKYVRYTPEQVEALERVYRECPKPSSLRRQQLIRECPTLSNIESKQIKVWFQNRRYQCSAMESALVHLYAFIHKFVALGAERNSERNRHSFRL